MGGLLACSTPKKSVTSVELEIDSVDSVAGMEIIRGSDCYTCHKLAEKLVVPSFMDVARKYEKDAGVLEKLSNKIRDGGSGS